MQVGDIVRVVKQPPNQIAHIVGEVGFVNQIDSTGKFGREEWIDFMALKLNGELSGCGAVPGDCVELETSPEWAEAKVKYDRLREQSLEESRAYNERFKAGVAEIAERHGLTPEVVRQIHEEVSRLGP